eukprot:10588-Heterococcus_DN1.PRE.2
MVYSTDSQYLAIATVDGKIHVWRAQYDGEFKRYVSLAGYPKRTAITLQFRTVPVAWGGQRVVLSVLYNGDQCITLHTYDILTEQEVRQPVTVIPNTGTSDVLVAVSGDMERVVSATRVTSVMQIVNPLTHASSDAAQQLSVLLSAEVSAYPEAIALLNKHPAAAFDLLTKIISRTKDTKTRTLIEHAVLSASSSCAELVCLLDPDKAVLNDATDDLKWKLALCTCTSAFRVSPMQLILHSEHSHAASLVLRVLAKSWHTLPADAIHMPDLIDLLKKFPTLAVPFLADQVKLVQLGERFYLTSDLLRAARCGSHWTRAAASLQAVTSKYE